MEKKRRLVMMKLVAILLSCYLVIFPLGQLVRIPVQLIKLPELNLYSTDFVLFLMVIFWLGQKLIIKQSWYLPPLGKPILLFSFLALFSLVVNIPRLEIQELGVSFLYLLRWVVYAGIYFVIYDLGQNEKFKVQSISNGLVLAGLVAAVLGLIQYIFLPDTRFLEKWGWDPHYYRAIGTFLDPGFLGIILVLILILVTLQIWSNRKLSWRVAIWLVVYLALALTYSRASYLAYLGSMSVIAWVKKSPQFFLGVFLLGIVTIFLLPRPGGEGVRLERESTITFRMTNWGQSLTIIKDHPVFGVGFNAYRYAQKRYGFLNEQNYQVSHAGGGADSSLLFVLATMGILGFSAYLWLWLVIIQSAISNQQSAISNVVFASSIALLIHSLFLNSLFYPWVMGWFWILLGIGQLKEKNSL